MSLQCRLRSPAAAGAGWPKRHCPRRRRSPVQPVGLISGLLISAVLVLLALAVLVLLALAVLVLLALAVLVLLALAVLVLLALWPDWSC